jgi:FkbM family methyltransferase
MNRFISKIIRFFRKNRYYVYLKNNFIYRFYSEIRDTRKIKNWLKDDDEKFIFYQKLVKPGSLCFDIGANIGLMTKIFLKLGARVVALEPQNECANLIRKSLKNPNLTIVEKAVGETLGFCELIVCDINSMSSISTEWIQSVKESGRYSDKWWYEKRIVPTTTLDQLISEFGDPDYIKIDVEGNELNVIHGLSKKVEFLSFEHTPELRQNSQKIFDHLSKLGNYKWNYCFADKAIFEFPNWKEKTELNIFLNENNYSNQIGDIYIHYEI